MSTSLSSRLTVALRDELLSGAFKPGQQLRLNQLCQHFDVSLSPLREALSRLAAEGLVIAQEQRGYWVAPISRANYLEITSLRTMLEPVALRASIEQGNEEWEVELVAAHHRLQSVERRAATDRVNPEEWEGRHRDFHRMLFSGGDMPVLAQFCEQLLDFSDRYRRIFISARTLDRDVVQEHDLILQATLDRDAATACALLTQHIERTAANIALTLAQTEQGEPAAATRSPLQEMAGR